MIEYFFKLEATPFVAVVQRDFCGNKKNRNIVTCMFQCHKLTLRTYRWQHFKHAQESHHHFEKPENFSKVKY